MMEVKGSTIKDMPQYIKDKYGEEKYQKWFNSLSDEAKEVFGKSILASNWYPLRTSQKEAEEKILELFHGSDPKISKELSMEMTKRTFSGVYKVFIKMGSPSFFVNRIVSSSSSIIRPTKMEVIENSADHAIVRLTEFPEIYESFEYVLEGMFQATIELSGGKNVVVKKNSSMAKGDQYTEFVCTWE
jgi:hypothetical protein